MPPPYRPATLGCGDELLEKVEFRTVRLPPVLNVLSWIPAPAKPLLFAIKQLLTVNVSAFAVIPPEWTVSGAKPPLMVMPAIVTVSPGSMVKMPKAGAFASRWTCRLDGPRPRILTFWLGASSALSRGIAPVTPKLIVLGPDWALACVSASRSEPAPLSARLVTVNVDGISLSSSTSNDGRTRDRGRRHDVWFASQRGR